MKRLGVLLIVSLAAVGCGVRHRDGDTGSATSSTVAATAPSTSVAARGSSTTSGGATTTAAPSSKTGGTDASLPGRDPIVVKPGVPTSGRSVVRTLITDDGRTRTYRLYVPPAVSAHPDRQVPLLIALHGGLGWGAQFQRNSGYDELAEANGFIVVFPDGIDAGTATRPIPTWNGGACCGPAVRQGVDDVGFISDLITELEGAYPIDPGAVVATGHSNGGILALRLGCEIADQISAVGVQSSSLEVSTCHPSEPVSVLQIHGVADQNLPIDGGIGPKAVSGVAFRPPRDAAKAFAAADGCPAPRSSSVAANRDLHVTSWAPCEHGTQVAFVAVDGATHAWMGHPTGGSGLTGPPYPDLDSSLVIWNFLSQHTRT